MTLADSGKRRHIRTRAARAARIAAIATVLPVTLTACSWSDLGMGTGPAAQSTAHTTTHTSSATAAPARIADRGAAASVTGVRYVRGDLAAGTVTHQVAMGNRTLVITYWTARNVGEWQSSQSAQVQLAAHVENSRSSLKIVVSRFSATFVPDRDADASTLRVDTGAFAMTPPFSYNTALAVPAVGARTTSARVDVEFDLLIETAPHSGQYFRQTALDSLSFTYPTAANA